MNSSPKEEITKAGERTQLTIKLNWIVAKVEEIHRRFKTDRHWPNLVLEKGNEIAVCPLRVRPEADGEHLALQAITEMTMKSSPDKAYLVGFRADKIKGGEIVGCWCADRLRCEWTGGKIVRVGELPPQIIWTGVLDEDKLDDPWLDAFRAGFVLASTRNGASLTSLAGLTIKAAGESATWAVVQA